MQNGPDPGGMDRGRDVLWRVTFGRGVNASPAAGFQKKRLRQKSPAPGLCRSRPGDYLYGVAAPGPVMPTARKAHPASLPFTTSRP